MLAAEKYADRHPATVQLLKHFAWFHLPGHLIPVSRSCGRLAEDMVTRLQDGPELSAGLRKLLEAKDCFVRAAIDAPNEGDDPKPLSQSPHPRPKVVAPPSAYSWGLDKVQHIVGEYNTMIDEIEQLSALIVSMGGDPRNAFELNDAAATSDKLPRD